MEIQILKANPTDSDELTRIARASKSYWGYPEELLSAWSEQLLITPEMIVDHMIYKARIQNATAAFYVLVAQPDRAMLDHLWVKPEYIGQGIGRLLFKHALRQAAALGASQVVIESDPNALDFYLKMGAYQVGTRSSMLERELPILNCGGQAWPLTIYPG